MMSAGGNTPERPEKARVLIIDENRVIRKGLSRIIGSQEDMKIVGEARDMIEALSMASTRSFDLAIVDLMPPGERGSLELVKALRIGFPRSAVIVLSIHDEPVYAERALSAGAGGYVIKDEPLDEILAAARTVLDGRIFISRRVVSRSAGLTRGGRAFQFRGYTCVHEFGDG